MRKRTRPDRWDRLAHEADQVRAGRDFHEAAVARELYQWCAGLPTADIVPVAAALSVVTGHRAPWHRPWPIETPRHAD